MADLPPPIQFEDVPLDEARRMSRGPRMEPMLYETLRQKIQTLSSEAVRVHLGPEITPTRMKNYILSIARELNVPVTVRRMPARADVIPHQCKGCSDTLLKIVDAARGHATCGCHDT